MTVYVCFSVILFGVYICLRACLFIFVCLRVCICVRMFVIVRVHVLCAWASTSLCEYLRTLRRLFLKVETSPCKCQVNVFSCVSQGSSI